MIETIIIMIWMGFGVLCSVIAPGRGRSAGAWFVLGLVFGVFGLVALLAMPSVSDVAINLTAETRTCPYCAEEIKAAAIVCKHCGRDVEAAVVQSEPD